MGFPKWLKPVLKTTGQAALQGAISANPAVSTAVQITQAFINSEQPVTEELVKTLNTLLKPQGYLVIQIPK
jgi:hypothetical protein